MADSFHQARTPDSLTGSAANLVTKLQRAYASLNEHPMIDEHYVHELSTLEDVVVVVKQQPRLQNAKVEDLLRRLRRLVQRLEEWQDKNKRSDRHAAQRLAYQLAKGSKEEMELGEIMRDVSGVKIDLCLHISIAALGVPQSVDTFPAEGSKDAQSSATARHTKDKPANLEGSLRLTRSVLAEEGSEDHQSSDEMGPGLDPGGFPENEKVRIVSNNIAEEWAFQVNSAIGPDNSRHIHKLVIDNNKAERHSFQLNHPTTTDVFLMTIKQLEAALRTRARPGSGSD